MTSIVTIFFVLNIFGKKKQTTTSTQRDISCPQFSDWSIFQVGIFDWWKILGEKDISCPQFSDWSIFQVRILIGGKSLEETTCGARSFPIGQFFRLDFFIGGRSLVEHASSSWIVTSLFEKNNKLTNRPWMMTSAILFYYLYKENSGRAVVLNIFGKKNKLQVPSEKDISCPQFSDWSIFQVGIFDWLKILGDKDIWCPQFSDWSIFQVGVFDWRKILIEKDISCPQFPIGQFFRFNFFIGGESLVDTSKYVCVVIPDRDVTFRKKKKN